MTLADAFESQAKSCAERGSELTAAVIRATFCNLDAAPMTAAKIGVWTGDPSGLKDGLALRLASAIHALLLQHRAPELLDVYPPAWRVGTDINAPIRQAMADHDAFIHDWIDRPPQTNEIRRSAGLIAVLHWLAAKAQAPIALSEMGASAGLNLLCDQFFLDVGDGYGDPNASIHLSPTWTGPHPQVATPVVVDRAGCDLAPIDVTNSDHVLRLRSYIWPDQPKRWTNTAAAIDLGPPCPDAMDALDWLKARLDQVPMDRTHLVYSTVAFQYFPARVQSEIADALAQHGARRGADAPLVWLMIEADRTLTGAAIQTQVWPNGKTTTLGEMDMHGTWITWKGEA